MPSDAGWRRHSYHRLDRSTQPIAHILAFYWQQCPRQASLDKHGVIFQLADKAAAAAPAAAFLGSKHSLAFAVFSARNGTRASAPMLEIGSALHRIRAAKHDMPSRAVPCQDSIQRLGPDFAALSGQMSAGDVQLFFFFRHFTGRVSSSCTSACQAQASDRSAQSSRHSSSRNDLRNQSGQKASKSASWPRGNSNRRHLPIPPRTRPARLQSRRRHSSPLRAAPRTPPKIVFQQWRFVSFRFVPGSKTSSANANLIDRSICWQLFFCFSS